MEDIFKFATLVPRVASHTSLPHYLGEVDDIVELSEIKEELVRRVDLVISQVIMHTGMVLEVLTQNGI